MIVVYFIFAALMVILLISFLFLLSLPSVQKNWKNDRIHPQQNARMLGDIIERCEKNERKIGDGSS